MKRAKKKKSAKDLAHDARVTLLATGFRDGVENERAGTVARLRVCGLDELADALETENHFGFAVAAFRLRDEVAARKAARETAQDRADAERARQMDLLAWKAPPTKAGRGVGGVGARVTGVTKSAARKKASSSARSSVSGSSSRKARKARI